MSPFSPSIMDATEITEVTPITMPRIVSPDRTLRELSVSSATRRFSWSSVRVIPRSKPDLPFAFLTFPPGAPPLLASQCRHRIEPRRLDRRVDSEEDTDRRAEKHSEQRHPRLDRCR